MLGGYRARARALEKQMQKKQKNSRGYAGQNVEKLRATQDKLFEQYKAAKSAEQRDVLGAKFDEASAALRAAEQRFKGEDVMWPGADQDIKALREAFLKVEWLEDAISRGDFELRAPTQAVKKLPTAADRAASKQEQNQKEVAEGAARADAPSTSGANLLKSQIQKLQKPQKTQYQSKGTRTDQALFKNSPAARAATKLEEEERRVFEQEQKLAKKKTKAGRAMAEFLETARQLSRAEALDPKNPSSGKRGGTFLERETTALSDDAVEAAKDGRLFDVLDHLEENGSSQFVKDTAKKLRPLLLRAKMRVHEGLVDKIGRAHV